MPILNFFRNLFGGGDRQEPPYYRPNDDSPSYRSKYRNPIWQTDDDDDDDVGDFRQPSFGAHFHVFSDPFEIAKYFESQMDNMLKDFFHGFGSGGMGLPFDQSPFEALPYDQPNTKGSLRDQFLKSDDSQKLDTDLDGKIDAKNFSSVWDNPSRENAVEPHVPRRQFNVQMFGKSITSQIVRRPDGTMEHRQTVRDNQGNEETTVTRQIGDKTHKVTTVRSKDGTESKTEDLINMDENELMDFESKWKPRFDSGRSGPSDSFPWHKFFGPNPKL